MPKAMKLEFGKGRLLARTGGAKKPSWEAAGSLYAEWYFQMAQHGLVRIVGQQVERDGCTGSLWARTKKGDDCIAALRGEQRDG